MLCLSVLVKLSVVVDCNKIHFCLLVVMWEQVVAVVVDYDLNFLVFVPFLFFSQLMRMMDDDLV